MQTSAEALYLDSSALVKLVVDEPSSEALVRFIEAHDWLISSALARTEVIRAVRPAGTLEVERARHLLQRTNLIAVDASVLDRAATMDPSNLRSLDAIHLATAVTVGDDLAAFLTYDRRLASAARLAGLTVEAPS